MSIGAQKASARIAAKSAVKIRAGLATSIDAARVVAGYMDTHPQVTDSPSKDRARARAWAMNNVSFNFDAYKSALRQHYADMYVFGQYASLENMAVAAARKAVAANSKAEKRKDGSVIFNPDFSINWDTWVPGNEGAAALLEAPGGLKKLLGDIDIQARGIGDTSHDLLGTALADGIAAGNTPVQIANDIRDSLSNPARALTIAVTEGARAKIAANLDSYTANGADQIQWTVNDPDDADCLDNDGKIVNIGDQFPSGDTQPPVHPNCQCDVIPVMPDLNSIPDYSDSSDEGDDSEMAVVADLVKYNPDQPRDAHGRFGSGSEVSTSGRANRYGIEAAAHAEAVYSHAARVEPGITATMKDLAGQNGAKLEGLDFRLKSQESLTRKIATDAADKGISPAEAAAQISDSVRYTMVTDPANYTATAQSVKDQLESQGYQVNAKNYWQEGSNYKGVNMALVDPSGQRIELQMHTPESLSLKEDVQHPLYESYRVLDPASPEAQAINAQMVANAASLETPPGIESFGTPKVAKSLDIYDSRGYDANERGAL